MEVETSECQERSEGRIGNTAELLDTAVGHFGPILWGTQPCDDRQQALLSQCDLTTCLNEKRGGYGQLGQRGIVVDDELSVADEAQRVADVGGVG